MYMLKIATKTVAINKKLTDVCAGERCGCNSFVG